ncbi:MAG: AAA family ATPase [Firmicutes bacterium]|nr:AAA family ATPase [Bacillota bacterium]
MSFLIAVTGKGGVGKTTLSALLIKNLIDAGKTPVLAIDADPNSCLDRALGVRAENTVGRAREEVRGAASSGTVTGISKNEMLRMKIGQSLVEAEGFDLIAMGRPEGAGCYCYANNVLKDVIAEISSQYPYVVLDNEAGLENLSRRIVQKVDLLALVSDASNAGLNTLVRLYGLANEMEMKYDRLALVVNRLRTGRLPERMDEIKETTKADLVVGLPDDAEIAEFAEGDRSYLGISGGNDVYMKVGKLLY